MSPRLATEPIICPFIVDIDDREGLPFGFLGMKADAKDGCRPIEVRTQISRRKTGDYGIVDPDGVLDLSGVTVERKADDLPNSLTWRRPQFEDELARANDEFEFTAVVCQHSWLEIAFEKIGGSQASNRSMVGSILALSQRYPKTHWYMAGDRRLAELLTFRILERFYRDKLKAAQEAAK